MFNIKNIDKNRKKISYLKLRKIAMQALIALRVLYPGLLTVAGVTLLTTAGNATPFVRDDVINHLYVTKTMDSLGNEKTIGKYNDRTFAEDSIIKHYSKWNKVDDSYRREVKTYNMKKIDSYLVESIILEKETINKLEDLFGKPISTDYEYRDNVTDEELNSSNYLEATVYSIDKNQVIKVKENVIRNIASTIRTMFFALVATNCVYTVRFNFINGYSMRDAKRDYENEKYKYNAAIRKYERS